MEDVNDWKSLATDKVPPLKVEMFARACSKYLDFITK